MLRKIRYLLDLLEIRLSIVFINYETTLKITKQTSTIIVFINKLNLRLIRALNYIQRFDLKLRHKLDKQHVVFDALLRLASTNDIINK